ncbi:MAG: sugar nucleotide-binding protein, partial [Myxococcales bacterium]|nr:sugar nucleotide-binding protein [Myxococcales bacterium]
QALEDCVGPEVPVILLSSAAVYGPARPAAYAEVDPPQPTGPLGQGKRIAEQALRAGARRTALRLGLLYGPGHLPLTPTGRHPDGLQRLRHGRSIPTPRGATLQPLASRDLGGLVRRLLADPTPPRLLNVAGPVSVGWRGWLGAWAHALGCPVPACVPTSRAALVAAATPALAAFIHALLSPPQLDRRTLDGYHPGPWTSLTEGVAEAAAALAAPELRAVEPAAGGPDSGGPEGPAGRR